MTQGKPDTMRQFRTCRCSDGLVRTPPSGYIGDAEVSSEQTCDCFNHGMTRIEMPSGYVDRAEWGVAKSKTHVQRKCKMQPTRVIRNQEDACRHLWIAVVSGAINDVLSLNGESSDAARWLCEESEDGNRVMEWAGFEAPRREAVRKFVYNLMLQAARGNVLEIKTRFSENGIRTKHRYIGTTDGPMMRLDKAGVEVVTTKGRKIKFARKFLERTEYLGKHKAEPLRWVVERMQQMVAVEYPETSPDAVRNDGRFRDAG